MAEIAGVFHWPLSDLRELSLGELVDWRNRAIDFFNRTRREHD